ncbi:phage late control D family protein [Xenorhabdus bovienii]|uniref:contractile injection system protein, VgrG/Pvc8 family n=1 Tax=Xenorhabdus bovienii TaxID=40576 RepID=UPI00302DA7B2|nr:phage late control D family protein [Xenorhabdus bovienii]MDE9477397.1 phage late control D family protein [Xenorhabdus bovienii]MDE9530278.1 phage late control D family protein [Xenorhabdus bovienii]
MIDVEKWIPNTDWVPQFDLVTGKTSKPAFRLEINKQDISGKIQSRLMSLTLTDNRGLESDQLDIELDDADGMLKLPRRGDILILELGWHGDSLTPKGKFVVDEIEHTGAPDRLTIRARSADFRGDLNVKREESYHKHTLESIVSTIAARNQLTFKISEELKGISMHIDQTNESDVSFLTRVAKQEGAIASVKNGELLFIRQGQNKTGSGENILPVLITRESGDSHRFSLSDREAYTGVVAQWQDTRTTTKQTVKLKRVESKSGKVEIIIEYGSSENKSSGKGNSKKDKNPVQKDETPVQKDKNPIQKEKYSAQKKESSTFKKEKDRKIESPREVISAKPAKTGVVNLEKKKGVDLTKKSHKTKVKDKPDYIKKGQKESKRKNRDNRNIDREKNIDIGGSLSSEKQSKSTAEHHQTTKVQKKSANYLVGAEENVLTLSRVYSNKENAERAAKAVWEKMQRGAAEFSIALAKGRADIYPETPVHIEGFKPEINGTSWTIIKVTHNLNDSGFTTSLDLELKIDDFEIKTEDVEIKA